MKEDPARRRKGQRAEKDGVEEREVDHGTNKGDLGGEAAEEGVAGRGRGGWGRVDVDVGGEGL